MAPVLQCPECGTKHPLDDVGDRGAFPCSGCGRLLKVPDTARARIGRGAPLPAPVPVPPSALASAPTPLSVPSAGIPSAPEPVVPAPSGVLFDHEAADALPGPLTAPPPPVPSARRAAGARRSRDPVPALWIRLLLWIVAVPLAFIIVFACARVFGFLSSTQLEDVWLANGLGRFMPIVRLLPFVALTIALIVHGGVLGITQLRRRRFAVPGSNDQVSMRNQSRAPRASRTGS